MRREVISESGLRQMADAIVAILSRQGVRVEHDGIWQALQGTGAVLDQSERIARFPESYLADFVNTRPDKGQHRLDREPAQEYSAGMGFEIDPYYYDYPSGPRLATRDDLIRMVKLGEMVPEVRSVGAPVVANDINPRLEAIESLVTVAQHTSKHISAVSLYPHENKYMMEIAAILYGPEERMRFVGSGGFLTSPMTLGERMGDLMFAAREFGLDVVHSATMTVAGMSAPVTTAGAAAMAASEIIAGWLLARAINPNVRRYLGGAVTGVLDMRTMRACYGTPEAALQDVTAALVIEKHFGGGAGAGSAGYTDARVPGLQLTYEKITRSVFDEVALGYPLRLYNPGICDTGRTFSPTQFMLDLDVDRSMWQFDRGVEVNEETLGLEAIMEAGIHSGAGYLASAHTLRNFRDAIWYPRLFDRRTDMALGGGSEASILERADAAWREAVARYQQPELDPNKVKALNDVLRSARTELLG